jgi:hypothetical protein
MMEVPEHTEVGEIQCDGCGGSMSVTSGIPGSLIVWQCACPEVHGIIVPPLTPQDDQVPDIPIRRRSAHVPRPSNSIERTCEGCGASFLGLAPGKTGERGIWREWNWYCSTECDPAICEDEGT